MVLLCIEYSERILWNIRDIILVNLTRQKEGAQWEEEEEEAGVPTPSADAPTDPTSDLRMDFSLNNKLTLITFFFNTTHLS